MSLSKKSKIIIVVILGLLLGSFVAYKIAYKSHKTVSDLDVGFSGTAADFFNTITAENNTILENAAIQLTGKVTHADTKSITLNNTIHCLLNNNTVQTTTAIGQQITIKGRYIGYDDLLEEIKLDKTIILK